MKQFNKKAILRGFSLAVTLLVSILLMALTWFYTTESGLQWLVNRTAQFHPPALKIGKVSGTLSSTVYLTELEWQAEKTKIQVEDIAVDCQWLYLLDRALTCDNISTTRLDVMNATEEKTAKSDVNLPVLNAVEFPIDVNIKQVSIAKIVYSANSAEISQSNNQSPSEQPQYVVNQLNIKKIALAGSKASVGALALNYDEHLVSVAGNIDMRKKWQHQLAINIQGPKLSASAKSKGHLTASSTLAIQLKVPNQLLVSAEWYYDQGLFLKNGNITAEKQQVALSNENIAIDYIKGDFALTWPKFNANVQSKATWQALEPISITVNTQLEDVLKWSTNANAKLAIKSELKDAQIAASLQQVFPDAINNQEVSEKPSWPVSANLEMNVNQGLLTFKSNNIKLAELTAKVQGELSIDNPTANNLWFNGKVEGRSLDLNNILQVANIKADWQIKKQNANWLIASKGKVEQLAVENFDGKNIEWSLDFGKNWLAKFTADSLKVNDNTIELASLNFSGLPEKHLMRLSANLAENTAVNLNFNGELLQNNSQNLNLDSDFSNAVWQINQLEFQAINQQEKLLIATEQLQLSKDKQRIKNLCLSGDGKMCINAENSAQQWSANLFFEQWKMSPVFKQIKAWQSILLTSSNQTLQNLEGTVNGTLSVTGQAKNLKNIAADITIPNVKWQSAQTQVQADNFTINTKMKKQDIALVTQWNSINTQIILPQSQTEVVMPKGQVLLTITPDFKVDYDLEQTDIALNIPDSKIKADSQFSKHLITVSKFKLQGQWQQNKLNSQLHIRLPGDDEIKAKLNSDWPLIDSAKINGDLALNMKEFGWLKQWQKGLDKIDLNLEQNFTVAGTLHTPVIEGSGALAIKHLIIDEYGLDIRNSNIKITSQQDSIILIGELQNPQGSLIIAGDAKLSTPMKANLSIEGQQVTLVNNNENKLIVSPQLSAKYLNNHLSVTGNLVVDQADIKVASLPKPAISVSEDQIIIDEKEQITKDSPFDYDISLTLSAGDNVKVSGFGLSSEIQGKLSSTLKTGQALTLNGRLDLKDGKFEAYKQTLTIEQGQLLFLGTAANPSIQFRAIRMVDDIKVGIIADGTIQKPRLTLFSEPTMAEENVLSLLITGRNLDSLSQQEGNALTSAAISLGVDSANKLVQKIGSKLGLKDIAFTSKSGTNGNGTRVDIAAKINDRLNVGYGTNIDAESGVQAGWSIEYKLSPNISFEAISGEEISANINYKKQFSSTKDKSTQKDNKDPKEQE